MIFCIKFKLTDNANRSYAHGHSGDAVMECSQLNHDSQQYIIHRDLAWSPALYTMHAMAVYENCANCSLQCDCENAKIRIEFICLFFVPFCFVYIVP